jgi:hypothetical protein
VNGRRACLFRGRGDERTKALGFAADDGDHKWETEESCADKRLRRACDAEPDGDLLLERTWVDALPVTAARYLPDQVMFVELRSSSSR